MYSLCALFKRSASDELVKLGGAQRASQGCGTAACDAPAEPLQWQASFRRVQHGQAGGVRCRRQRPVQLADATTVETCCKLTVRAATHIGEGGRTHRDDQRSNQPSWHNLLSKVPMRRGWAWVRERPAAHRECPYGPPEPRFAQGYHPRRPGLEDQSLTWGSSGR